MKWFKKMFVSARAAYVAAVTTLVLVASGAPSHAAVPTEISGILTDVSGLFDDVKVVVGAVVAFGILLAIIKLAKRK